MSLSSAGPSRARAQLDRNEDGGEQAGAERSSSDGSHVSDDDVGAPPARRDSWT
jgi:hypothetical protein